jgi:hypothetical protein
MVRTPKPKIDGKKRQRFSKADLEDAICKVQLKLCSIRKASHDHKIPRATLQRYLKNCGSTNPESTRVIPMKKLGRKCVLSETEEQVLVDLLSLLAKWGSPLKPFDIRILIRDYLDSIPNRKVEAFRNNMPGPDWITGWIEHACVF